MLTQRTRGLVIAGTLAAIGGDVRAQGAPAQGGVAGPYERARQLVESGRGTDGRQLTDSLVAASAPGSPALAEALWWRAALAADARDSERDLRRLVAEVPASPRAGAATVRLAQLALVRDRPDDAAALLTPLASGAPGAAGAAIDPARPLAAYWLARARLERRDAAGACSALAGAAGADADLATQVTALRGRLPGCAAPPPTPVVVASAAPAPRTAPSAQPPVTPPPQPPTSTPPVEVPPGPVPGPAPDPRPTPPSTTAPRPAPAPVTPPAASPVPAASRPAVTSPPDHVRPTTSAVPPAAPAPAGPAYAVQIAAYDRAPGAAALAARLRAAGLDATSEGQGPAGDQGPFRVKVGRYATRAAAAAALRDLRARGLTGFVTTAPRAPTAGAAATPGARP